MNVGIVTYWFERGASYVSRAYKNVLEKENRVFIYARGGEEFSKGNPDWDQESVTWDTHYYSRIATYINLDRFKIWLKEKKIDIVIFNEQHWWLPVLLCKQIGIKTGAYIDYYTAETVPFFHAYDFVICNTKRHASVFSYHPQCFYIPWGTDVQLFKPTESSLTQKEYVTFFHSAGYSPDRKGTDLLIKAFSKIDDDSSKLIIHCQKPVVHFFPKLSQIIQDLQKCGRLILIEKTITAPGAYLLGDFYVYPTKLEGIGLTIAEALSSGLPVLTSDSPPMNEFITPETGRLVKIDFFKERFDSYYWPECYCSVADLTAQMKAVVKEIENLPALKRSSRQYAVEHLDFSKNAAVLNRHLETLRILPVAPEIEKQIEQFEKNRFNFIWRKKIFAPLWYLLYKIKPLVKKIKATRNN